MKERWHFVPIVLAITSNTCTAGWSDVTSIYHCDNCGNILSWTQATFTYVAIATTTRISFAIREDVGYFAVDDISVKNSGDTELLTNGGFETGSKTNWFYCNPNGASASGVITSSASNRRTSYSPHSGTYFYWDGAVGVADYLSQTFSTIIGQTYTVTY
ncbi:unnamed protein product [Didymodactylos carnosus]|uniref:Uncharacterized protein n=1 Tax=Didymodactylos carnosus TaxID=1234261 RepID=A0A815HSK9_9BILA|nr:unnamed protein product [Didymodactylos carnosus]CAF1357928.1 unnamed protein product [Didymodactylos carnosus]CAF4149091.1 unnamed protein product [Didymodactylos carnosus]CAF4233594.1 unnamed protein product [Didymodactylos carnosus]